MNNEIPETDLVVLAEQDVITKGRQVLKAWRAMGISTGTEFDARKLEYNELQCELLSAMTLLESREAVKATEHLDSPQRDPDHLNPDKGGNRAGDDYW